MENPDIRQIVQYTSTHLPYTERINNELTIKVQPRERDFADSFIEYMYAGSLALIGGGGLSMLSDYVTSNNREGTINWPSISLSAGVVLGGLTRFVVTLNNHRHTQNFYHHYDQAEARVSAERQIAQ